MVDPSHTFLHVLQQALDFKDRHALGESDVERIVAGVVDVTCVEKQRTADDITFSVLSSSTIASALVWGDFNDILFDIPSIVESTTQPTEQPANVRTLTRRRIGPWTPRSWSAMCMQLRWKRCKLGGRKQAHGVQPGKNLCMPPAICAPSWARFWTKLLKRGDNNNNGGRPLGQMPFVGRRMTTIQSFGRKAPRSSSRWSSSGLRRNWGRLCTIP